MPEWIWFFVAFLLAGLGMLLALAVVAAGWMLWRRYRHESGKPDVRLYRHDPPDSDERHR